VLARTKSCSTLSNPLLLFTESAEEALCLHCTERESKIGARAVGRTDRRSDGRTGGRTDGPAGGQTDAVARCSLRCARRHAAPPSPFNVRARAPKDRKGLLVGVPLRGPLREQF